MSALIETRPVILPVEYENAIQALATCIRLDETKLWDSKADLLLMWAKVNKSPEAELAAKRLKLYSYRRIGQIAGELRPMKRGTRKGATRAGQEPGPVSLLIENGFNRGQANAARLIAKIPEAQFAELLKSPVAPTTAATSTLLVSGDPVWREFMRYACGLRSFLQRRSAKEIRDLVSRMGKRQQATLRGIVRGIASELSKLG